MAARRPGKVAAPVKQKLRKKHGPKKKMFHKFDSTFRLQAGQAGILTKYYDYESFAMSCNARGVRTFVSDLWYDFCRLPFDKRKEFLKDIKNRETEASQKAAAKAKKALTKGKK